MLVIRRKVGIFGHEGFHRREPLPFPQGAVYPSPYFIPPRFLLNVLSRGITDQSLVDLNAKAGA